MGGHALLSQPGPQAATVTDIDRWLKPLRQTVAVRHGMAQGDPAPDLIRGLS
jgi:hypothetical protein